MKSIAVVASLLAANSVEASITFGKKCPKWNQDYTTQPNLDVNRYQGRWYEIQRDRDTTFEWTSTCVTATYTIADAANGVINVKNRGWYWYFFFSYYFVEGQAKCYAEGRCKVDFSKNKNLDATPNYHVLSTDYTKYSIVYGCEEVFWGLAAGEALWILGREKTMS